VLLIECNLWCLSCYFIAMLSVVTLFSVLKAFGKALFLGTSSSIISLFYTSNLYSLVGTSMAVMSANEANWLLWWSFRKLGNRIWRHNYHWLFHFGHCHYVTKNIDSNLESWLTKQRYVLSVQHDLYLKAELQMIQNDNINCTYAIFHQLSCIYIPITKLDKISRNPCI